MNISHSGPEEMAENPNTSIGTSFRDAEIDLPKKGTAKAVMNSLPSSGLQEREEKPKTSFGTSFTDAETDLEKVGSAKGIKCFILTASSLQLNQLLFIVPLSAIKIIQKQGLNRSCYKDFGLYLAEPECYFFPDPKSMIQLPWKSEMAWLSCFMYQHGKPLKQCPRRILVEQIKKAEDLGYVMKTGIEPEFLLLKKDSIEMFNSEDQGPNNTFYTMRASKLLMRITDAMEQIGWGPYKIEHEVEGNMYEVCFQHADALTTADRWSFMKFMIQGLAEEEGLRATFMPTIETRKEPMRYCNELHIHHSLWRISDNEEVFPQDGGHLGLSDIAHHFLAGEIKHMKDLSAFYLSTVNSYKRLQDDNRLAIGYAIDSRWPAVRIVTNHGKPHRFELRVCDAASNPYLAHAALLASGLDGVKNNLDLPSALEIKNDVSGNRNLHKIGLEFPPETLGEALRLLAKGSAKELLGSDVIERYIKAKTGHWEEYIKIVTDWEVKLLDSY